MRRSLSGRLEQLAPPTLLRLISATSPSGVLELDTDRGLLRLEVDRGRVPVPTPGKLKIAREVLTSKVGEFRFLPCDVQHAATEVMSLTAFAEAAGPVGRGSDLVRLVGESASDGAAPSERPLIHVLPTAPLMDPLDDLVTDLESDAAAQFILAEVGVVAEDPRIWQGSVERRWRQLGWRMRLSQDTEDLDLEGLDLLVVHHQRAEARVGREEHWLGLLRRAAEVEPAIPVVWVGPLGDPTWVHQLINADVVFLIPAPQGKSGAAAKRFVADLSRVVDRQLQALPARSGPELVGGLAELVDALLQESGPDQGLRSLLQLASESFGRGAIFIVGESSIHCRAGYGYPLDRNQTELPRGIDFLERVIGSGEALLELAGGERGVDHLCTVLGVSVLPTETAVIPLGRLGAVAGLLVADRHGEELPGIDALVVFAGRLGGIILS